MIEVIQNRITNIVSEWNSDLEHLAKEIIALNFGAQLVDHGFELYLTGHTWYDDYDLWLFDEKWWPSRNYISLGKESLEFDRLIILEEYENILKKEISNSKARYRDLVVVVGLADSDINRLK
ncbi:hypothetical protein DVR12_13650 [Chitinophaga silvatica]|uniref:Uncharacterized protein n=1 Tax=Chitinophaga silvatica TaxID=2282649 RepID=A0A3E1Y8H5_9BACT|nr:hypothetical protein [Chitinophaga silvatica]RFS21703.1 hypothetical protein DVR12_13650 [Chitinophaga silvatica]